MRERAENAAARRWITAASGRCKAGVAALACLEVALGVSGVAAAWLMRGVVDSAVARSGAQFWRYGALLAGLAAAQLALLTANRLLAESVRTRLENTLRLRLFGNLLTGEYASVTAVHSGEWLNRMTSDAAVVADGAVAIAPGLAGLAAKLAGALALMSALAPWFTLALVPAALAAAAFAAVLRGPLKRLHRAVQESDGRQRVFLSERLASMMIVRTFAGERQTLRQAEEKAEEYRRARLRRSRFSAFCGAGFGAATRAAYVAGAVACGYGILSGTMSYGTFTAVLQLVGQIQAPLTGITGVLPRYYTMLASAERLMEAESFARAVSGTALGPAEIRRFYETRFEALALRGVRFTYQPPVRGGGEETRPVVLRDFSLTIRKGEYVAFTGPSGCGKSTVLKLLMGLYPPDAGERRLVCRDGKTLSLDARHIRLFGYVPQGIHLMSGTVREIVAYADPARAGDDDALWRALGIACADEFVRGLPGGLDAVLGERGAGLSEGQMQRLSIARALFADSPVLMLDECTSALDEQTERRVLDNLRSMTDRTVLAVTHRPAALAICDRCVALTEHGAEITEGGKR